MTDDPTRRKLDELLTEGKITREQYEAQLRATTSPPPIVEAELAAGPSGPAPAPPTESKSSMVVPILIGVAVCGFIGFLAIPLLLLLPAINAAREAARRNQCINSAKQLAIAVMNHETVTRSFPLATDFRDVPESGPPVYRPIGDAAPGNGGYSWVVKLLPYLEEIALHERIVEDTQRYDPRLAWGATGMQPAGLQLQYLRCPSFAGSVTSNAYPATAAVGNYVALAGTHRDTRAVVENGIMVSGAGSAGGGRRSSEIQDGASHTLLLCESAEEQIASWYCGSSSWVTGFDHANRFAAPEPGSDDLTLFGGPPTTGLNVEPYCQDCIGGSQRLKGPSSHHGGGVIVHGFADGSCRAISDSIDPGVYYALITINGTETVSRDDY